MPRMVQRLLAALNSHEPQRMAELFAPDYRSSQPVHPARGFGGREQVQANWTAVFSGVPDFAAELVDSCTDGATEWAEWTGMAFPGDGEYVFPGCLATLVVEDGIGTHVEPNVWVLHRR